MQIALAYSGLALLAGCGAPDFSSTGGRTTGFDSGFSSGYGSYGGGYGGAGMPGGGAPRQAGVRNRGAYGRIEFSFELDTQGNPFDVQENDVVVTLQRPDQQSARIPAFYDGGKTWRVRYTPDLPGRYSLTTVTLNGRQTQPEKLDRRDSEVSGTAGPGFVHRDPKDRTKFAFDNGNAYYPIGRNVARGADKAGQLPALLTSMGQAGLNWSRIQMRREDGTDLDWPDSGKAEIGRLSLDVARRWDEIIQSAEQAGVSVQVVLQQHGQFSTRVDADWDHHPWNKKNGGFLGTPDEFFTNPRAVSLTKSKYRYIVARWGYSPRILAWELFDEVESTDAIAHNHADEVSAWHDGMAAYLRQIDPYKHLITTSSDLNLAGIWRSMDYYQPHAHVDDAVAALTGTDARKLDKPLFFGWFGAPGAETTEAAPSLRRSVWASLMSDASGAAQPGLFGGPGLQQVVDVLRPAAEFVRVSGLAGRRGLAPGSVSVQTEGRGALSFSPGGGFGKSVKTEFTVLPSGLVEGIASLPAYLQGAAHRSLPSEVTFKVDYAQTGTFTVQFQQTAKAGARVALAVDGVVKASHDFAPADADKACDTSIQASVPAGSHTVRIENTGADWVMLRRFVLAPYAPALAVVARSSKDYAVAWLSNRSEAASGAPPPVSGKLSLAGLQPGSYRLTWWDTSTGKPIAEETAGVPGRDPWVIQTPPVVRDVALYVSRVNQKARAALAARPTPRKGARQD